MSIPVSCFLAQKQKSLHEITETLPLTEHGTFHLNLEKNLDTLLGLQLLHPLHFLCYKFYLKSYQSLKVVESYRGL